MFSIAHPWTHRFPSYRVRAHSVECRRRQGPLEFGDPLQRRPSQPLRITCDVTFPLTLETRYAAIEGGNKLEKIVQDGVV
jgi:hypothetical protein